MAAAGATATISPVLETQATPRSCRARRQAAIEANVARPMQESRPNLNVKIPRAKKSVKKRQRGGPIASSSSAPASVPVQVVETPSAAQLESEVVETITKRRRKERTVQKCQYCDRTFRKKSQKQIHERVHTGERPYVCKHPSCDKRYHRADHLSRHAASHMPHPERLYKCTICNRNFAQPGKLQRHIKAHEKPRPHACNICGEAYSKTCVLREHLKNVHGESMPFKCKKKGCGKEFSRFPLLRQHTEKHRMQKRTYTCEARDCNNVTFSRMIDFQKHIKKTHEKGTCYIEDYVNKNGKNPRLYCQPCDKLFKNPSEKSAHEKKHGIPAFARLSYPCRVSGCIARYTSICNLRIHMRDKHNENIAQAAPGPSRRGINAQVSGQSYEKLSGDDAPSSIVEDQLYEDDHPIQISDELFDRGIPGDARQTNSLVEKDCNNDSARAGASAAHHHLNVNQEVEMQDFIPSGEEVRSNAGPAKDIDQSDSEHSATDQNGSDSYESATSEDESHEESIEGNESNIEDSDASDEDESYTASSQDLNDFEGNLVVKPEELNGSTQENKSHIEEDPSPLFALFGDVAHQSSACLQVQPENNDRPMQPVNVQESFKPGDDACQSEPMQLSGHETIARWKDSEVQDSLNGSQLHILKQIRTERPPVPSSLEPLQAKDKPCVAFESYSNLKSSDWRQDKRPLASITSDKRSPRGSPESVGQDTAPIQNTRKSILSEDSVRSPTQQPNSNDVEDTGQKTARAIDISGKRKEHNPASLSQVTLGKESTKDCENNDVIMKHSLVPFPQENLHQGTNTEEPRNSWLSSCFHVHSSESVGSEVLKPNNSAIAAGERAISALEPGASEQHGRITDPELGSSSLETRSVTTNVNDKNPERTSPSTANPNEGEKSPPPPTLAQSAGKAVQQFHPVPMSMKMVTMHTINIKGSRCGSQENPQADKVPSESHRKGYSEKAARIASSIISAVAAPFRGLFRS